MKADSGQYARPSPAPERPRLAVVDTNVWLDIHYFREPVSQSVAALLQSPQWAAVRCEQTDAELTVVLQRTRFCPGPAERLRWVECLHRWQVCTPLYTLRAQAPYRCRDPQDQKFLDLALAAQAEVVLTKDKALLAVHRNARRYGLMILTPRQFIERLREDGPVLLHG